MTSHGSQQLRQFRRDIRDGVAIEIAAEKAFMSLSEAQSWIDDDKRNPPPPEAFELLGNQRSDDMARRKKEDQVEVVHAPDFKLAIKFYREDIRPAQAKVGEHAQEQSTAYKAIKKQCHIDPGAAKLAFKLAEMEDAKRDVFLRGLYGLMQGLRIGISRDLIDQMNDEDAPRMPVKETSAPGLATVN